MLPALVSPGSPAAREFRFLAASLVVNAQSNGQPVRATSNVRQPAFEPVGAMSNVRQPPFIVFVSPAEGDGSTAVAANTALAAAHQGNRVQALDADNERLGMTSLLAVAAPRSSEAAGDVSAGSDPELWHEAGEDVNGHRESGAARVHELMAPMLVPVGDRGQVTVVEAGSGSTSMRLPTEREFDLIIADGPPRLDGHIDEIVRSAGALVIVVRHRGKVEDARQLIGRLDLLGVRPLGYVYNRGGSSRARWIRRRFVRHGGDVPDQAEQQRPVDASVEDDLVERP
jgi:Mrp family chromosome partitioning ATPase